MTQPHSPDTLAQLMAVARQLREGDRVTVLKFANAILTDRQGKRSQRRKSHVTRRPPLEHWRIGS